MNTLAKLIAAIAALITSLALAWMAYHGVVIQHGGALLLSHRTDSMSLAISHDGNISHYQFAKAMTHETSQSMD